MRIGIIGLGNIAVKAYLPLLSNFPQHEFILCTRNKSRLEEIQSKYHFAIGRQKHSDLVEMDHVDAVFIHAATKAHYALVRYFLESNVHVYVDKPISDSIEETKTLCRLAKERQLVLMAGFNRRFAPQLQPMIEANSDLILIQKNRQKLTLGLRELIYDDFIHLVDTLLFLLKDAPEAMHADVKMNGNLLQHVTLMVRTKNKTGIALMNRQSGANEERLEVSGEQEKWILEDLETLWHYKNGQKTVSKLPDWTPVSERRGFKNAMAAFFVALANPDNSYRELKYTLAAHEMCEKIIQSQSSRYESIET